MVSKIRFALMAVSMFSSIGLASPALAASHARHSHATISRNVRAQDVPHRPGYFQTAPAGQLDYPHVFCCS